MHVHLWESITGLASNMLSDASVGYTCNNTDRECQLHMVTVHGGSRGLHNLTLIFVPLSMCIEAHVGANYL